MCYYVQYMATREKGDSTQLNSTRISSAQQISRKSSQISSSNELPVRVVMRALRCVARARQENVNAMQMQISSRLVPSLLFSIHLSSRGAATSKRSLRTNCAAPRRAAKSTLCSTRLDSTRRAQTHTVNSAAAAAGNAQQLQHYIPRVHYATFDRSPSSSRTHRLSVRSVPVRRDKFRSDLI